MENVISIGALLEPFELLGALLSFVNSNIINDYKKN
jgi:hypothetical protein